MSDVPLLEKMKCVEPSEHEDGFDFPPLNDTKPKYNKNKVFLENDVVDALIKFQEICNNQIKIHNKQLEFKCNELQRSYICGEIESYIEILEINNKVFGVLDSQDSLFNKNNEKLNKENSIKTKLNKGSDSP